MDTMVDTFGYRPRGILAPFGFGLPSPQPPDPFPRGDGQSPDSPDFPDYANVTPVARRRLFCQNVNCGEETGGVFYPLCQNCNTRLKYGDGPYRLEDGTIIVKPIPAGGLDN
jgi:hypothetical protein